MIVLSLWMVLTPAVVICLLMFRLGSGGEGQQAVLLALLCGGL